MCASHLTIASDLNQPDDRTYHVGEINSYLTDIRVSLHEISYDLNRIKAHLHELKELCHVQN